MSTDGHSGAIAVLGAEAQCTAAAIEGAKVRILAHARGLSDEFRAVDHELRRTGRSLPDGRHRERVIAGVQTLVRQLRLEEPAIPVADLPALRAEVRAIVMPWLWRSKYWWRSFAKPHGFAGDYQMIEWIYDLEDSDCADPHQTAFVNCLDAAFRATESSRDVWERRHWLAGLVVEEACSRAVTHVLDIACGGARYLRDACGQLPAGRRPFVTLLDQDAAALSYARDEWPGGSVPELICTSIRKLADSVSGRRFDVVLSAGLLDYLDDSSAARLLSLMRSLAAPDGRVATTNFHPDDRSAQTKSWLVDWQLELRTEADLRRVFESAGLQPTMQRSTNGGLVMATALA